MVDRATTASPSEIPLDLRLPARQGIMRTHWRRGPALARRVLGKATWLKPPARSLRHLAAWGYSTWNRWRATDIRRVNVGCGKDVRPDWWNLDYIHFPGVNEIRDATKPWRHQQLDFVFSEHFIEHLTLHQAIDFLTHAGNALKIGGVMRVSTPNVTWVIRDAFDFAPPTTQKRLNDTICVNSCFHAYGHQFLWSVELMRFVLTELGFHEVQQHNFGESDRPELQNLECHGEFEITAGEPNFIIFEATKGEGSIAPSAKLNALLQQHFTPDCIYR